MAASMAAGLRQYGQAATGISGILFIMPPKASAEPASEESG
jgi:hypothetical protein